MATLWQQYYKRENGGRAKENGEENQQHGVALKLDAKMRRGAFLLRGEARETPLACSPSSTHARGRLTQRGGHHERGELPLEEETQKWGKKPPILSLNLSLMPQGVTHGVEWAPHVVPITKWSIQWRW